MEHPSWKKNKEPFVIFALFVLAVILFVVILKFGTYNIGRERKDVRFGVTFSKLQTESLGLDWRETYGLVLDDLRVRLIRLPIYWTDVEPNASEFFFDDYHWMVAEAEARGVDVIPVLGMRVPRWPECHVPEWVNPKSQISNDKVTATPFEGETTPLILTSHDEEYVQHLQPKILRLLEREVAEFDHYSNILYWQVENEPLLGVFGICPFSDLEFTKQEFEQVRMHDPTRKIMGTESGEMSSWIEMSQMSDVLGSSLYRDTFNPIFGMFYYPIPPLYYQKKAEYVSHLVEKVIISELQAEPWVGAEYHSFEVDELRERFPLKLLRENVSFARKTQVDIVLLWGVEWWAYMRQHGIMDYWDYAKTLF